MTDNHYIPGKIYCTLANEKKSGTGNHFWHVAIYVWALQKQIHLYTRKLLSNTRGIFRIFNMWLNGDQHYCENFNIIMVSPLTCLRVSKTALMKIDTHAEKETLSKNKKKMQLLGGKFFPFLLHMPESFWIPYFKKQDCLESKQRTPRGFDVQKAKQEVTKDVHSGIVPVFPLLPVDEWFLGIFVVEHRYRDSPNPLPRDTPISTIF